MQPIYPYNCFNGMFLGKCLLTRELYIARQGEGLTPDDYWLAQPEDLDMIAEEKERQSYDGGVEYSSSMLPGVTLERHFWVICNVGPGKNINPPAFLHAPPPILL